jgi:3-oxoacyl-[acyl-carrier protein] reductase
MKLGLAGKTALVTAASRGIGRAVAHTLFDEGVRVAINARPGTSLAEAAQPSAAGPGELHAFPADLENAEATAQLIPRVIERFGRLDILVVNTAGPPILSLIDTRPEDWAAAHDRLFRPALQLAFPAARQMIAQGGGSIIFMTSTWVKQPAAKGGLSAVIRSSISALAKQMSLELAPHGIRVNQVMPGATATERTTAIMAAKAKANGTSIEAERALGIKDIPLGRIATPEEIANAVVFLASPASAFTTGVALQIDGGAVRSTV